MSKKAIAIISMVGFLATAGVAFAQTGTSTTSSTVTTTAAPVKKENHPMIANINANGHVLLRGTVDSVSANSLTVKSWGGDWTVNVPSSAKVLPQGSALSSFAQGDFVGLEGTVDTSASWTVTATLIRDWTARQALNQQEHSNESAAHAIMSNRPRVVQGTLSNLDATAKTFTLTDRAGTAYTVTLTATAEVIGKNWATLPLSKVNTGDTVRVYGTISSSTISASVFRDVSVK